MTATISSVLSEGAPGHRQLRLSPERREFIALMLWVLVTFVQFSGDQLLLYPLALYFAIRAWQQRSAILGLMSISWPLMLFPVWCLLSPIWAVAPSAALKESLYLILTMLICYHVALNVPPRQIMVAVLLATGFAGVLNLILGLPTGDYTKALFAHKNRMGTNMVILWTVSLVTLLDSQSLRVLRLFSAFSAVLALFMIANSFSATAILQAFGTGTLCVISVVLLRGGFWRPNKIALGCVFLALLAGAASIAVSTYNGNPVDDVLDAVGKGRGLTGRTVLWEYAKAEIAQRPLLGVGAGGFWNYNISPLVQRIYEEFYKAPEDVFNFHNSYYEIAVHQGLIGLALVIPALIWATVRLTRATMAFGTMPQIFFLCVLAAVLVRSMTEAELLKPFVIFDMTVWIGALSSEMALRARRNGGSPIA